MSRHWTSRRPASIMVADCWVKMTRSFWLMHPKPGILSEIGMGFFLILTLVSAIARRRCWTDASSDASTSPRLTSPVFVFPSQTQTGSLGAAVAVGAVLVAAAGAVAISYPPTAPARGGAR